jgi:hypothetical protein
VDIPVELLHNWAEEKHQGKRQREKRFRIRKRGAGSPRVPESAKHDCREAELRRGISSSWERLGHGKKRGRGRRSGGFYRRPYLERGLG